MSILSGEIINFIEEFAPVRLAEEWDNVGLILGGYSQVVNGIMVCLDVTSKVVDEAIEKNIDLIVSHHPLIFKGMKKINSEDSKGEIIYKLINNRIGVYSAHTNLDVTPNGINDSLAKLLGLCEIKNLRRLDGEEFGLGKVGVLEPAQSINEFISKVKENLNAPMVRVIGNIEREVKKVAVFCGSFDENWSGIINKGVDVLVTGDIKYHTALEITEMDLCVIDAGHFNTEKIIIPQLVDMLQMKFPGLNVISNSVEIDPFKFS